MTLRELMKMYDLKLEVAIIESQGDEKVSVVLVDVRYQSQPHEIRSFPGWGTDVDTAISDLIATMRQVTHIVLPKAAGREEQVLPLPRISAFS